MIQPFSSTGDEPFRPESGTSAHWLLSLPVRLEAWLGLTECDSSFGPLICLQTSLLLSSLRARLTFAERPDAASRVSTLEVPLLSAAQRLPSPRQIVRATRPRPELQLMVCDESGEALTDHASLGVCLNGWREVDAVFPVDTEVSLQLARRPAERSLGAPVAVHGELHFSRGCALRLELHWEDRTTTGLDVPLASSSRSVSFPERTARAGWHDDPYISVELVDDCGLVLGEERLLGRPLP